MPAATIKAMGPFEWSLLLALSLLWGGSFFFGEVALTQLPPFTVVLGRVGIAAVALQLAVRAAGHAMPRSLSAWGAFALMGALNNLVPFSLIYWGQTQISSSHASILNATTPLFTVVVAHFLARDERFTVGRIGGVLFGLAGVTVLIGPDALHGSGADVFAQLAVLGAALSYAFAGVYGRRFRGLPPLVTATGQLTCTTAMVLPIALIVDQPWTLPAPNAATWGALFGVALLSTAVAYVIYFRILATAGATNVLLVTFLMPVVALWLGISLLGERPAPGHFAGMALIALGLVAMDGRPLASLRRLASARPVAAPAVPGRNKG